MNKVRFRYTKTGKAKYISNLDLMATMQRGYLRAGLELKYSQGFNPHPYMSVALPLPVGSESICELIDVGLIDDMIPEVSTIILSDGITIFEAYKPIRKFNDISWVEVYVKIYYNKPVTKNLTDMVIQRLSEDSIIISKRTKRGFKDINIAPYIKDMVISINESSYITMIAKISANNPTLNTADIMSALTGEHKPDHIEIKRIDFYDSDMITFK